MADERYLEWQQGIFELKAYSVRQHRTYVIQ